jgi:7,8-dihydroneopterin aldolase/epimerase/oxygenase
MPDRIFLENLRLKSQVGISAQERGRPQEVLVDVELLVGLAVAGTSDNPNDAVNYKEVLKTVSEFVTTGRFTLLEALAEGVAATVHKKFPVDKVRVRVRKAKYSAEPSIGVEVTR